MIRALIITAIIILCNLLFFQYGGQEILSEQGYRSKEILHSIYKIIVYAGPMILVIWLRDKATLRQTLQNKFGWFSQPWVYFIWAGRLLLLLATKKIGTVEYGTYGFLYVLIVNSVVEETVFRGYIQDKLVAGFGKVKGIIGQAFLFGVIHLPFYYANYQAGLYDQMNNLIGGILPINSLGAFIVIFAIGSPIALGLLRGWIMNRTKSLRPSIVWHSIHNGILLFV